MAGDQSVRDMTSKFTKLEKFEGINFRRWQKKMHFLLTTLKVVYVLSTPMPEVMEDETLEMTRCRFKWENDDYICRGHIFNSMCDSLFDIFQNVESAKELWDSLESKYSGYGYVDEYDLLVLTGGSTRRKEIYSFGVVLLEVFTGKRNIDDNRPANERIQVDFIRPYLESKRGIRRIIDDRIYGQYPTTVAIRFAMIVKRCLSIKSEDTPTADEVVKALEELQDIEKAAPSRRVDKGEEMNVVLAC